MSRRIITTQLQSANNCEDVDTYPGKLVKNVPADIIVGWIAVKLSISAANDVPNNALLWGAFVIGIVLTALWTKKQTDKPGKPPAKTQILIAMGSFIVWVFALGEPFATLSWYRPLYAELLLTLYTFTVPLINPRE